MDILFTFRVVMSQERDAIVLEFKAISAIYAFFFTFYKLKEDKRSCALMTFEIKIDDWRVRSSQQSSTIKY